MDYSIIFIEADAGPCARCGAGTGNGIVGWSDQADRPVCDACLIEVSPHLGMVLNIALIFRQVGAIEPGGDPDAGEDLRVRRLEGVADAQAGADRVCEAIRGRGGCLSGPTRRRCATP